MRCVYIVQHACVRLENTYSHNRYRSSSVGKIFCALTSALALFALGFLGCLFRFVCTCVWGSVLCGCFACVRTHKNGYLNCSWRITQDACAQRAHTHTSEQNARSGPAPQRCHGTRYTYLGDHNHNARDSRTNKWNIITYHLTSEKQLTN